MATLPFVIVGVIQLVIVFYLLRHYQERKISYTLLILLVVFGIAYDNLAIASGSLLSEGSFLKSVNWLRFGLHAFLTPMMVIAIFGIARRMGLGWAQGKMAHALFCLFAVGLVAMGVGLDLIGLNLEPTLDAGVLRYADPEASPPIPAILTIVAAMVVGAMVWRKTKWSWLVIGGVVMFVASALGASRPLLANIGEVVFAASMAMSEVRSNQAINLDAIRRVADSLA